MGRFDAVIDVTTTSVGRLLIKDAYESFFRHARFEGKFDFVISVDPTYAVESSECDETVRWLRSLPDIDSRVRRVTVERLPRNVGLQRSLMLLFSHCRQEYGAHIEDDWRFFADIDLDALIADMVDQKSALIGFNSTHVSARGTFERVAEVEALSGTRVPLVRLVPPSWACDYLPLCPHVHQARVWIPAYTKALMLDDDVDMCPDERVKEFVRSGGRRLEYNMLWTRDVVVEDIGRQWLADRNQAKNIGPDSRVVSQPMAVHVSEASLLLERSKAIWKRAEAVIPGGTQTFMKRPSQFAPGVYPILADRGEGSRICDVDGNVYIDFIAALGAASLGFGATAITAAVKAAVGRGPLLSLPTPLEVEAAELVASSVPGVEMVRFFKTGADACSAAVRVARYVTGKNGVASCGYHGFHDLFTAETPGVPRELSAQVQNFDPFESDGPKSLESGLQAGDVGCVLLAVPYHRRLSQRRVQNIVQLCRAHGALFVLDEVVTGFRLALGGAQETFDVRADLVCLSKSLAGGMPLAALCGARLTMEPLADTHVSTTFGGEMVSLAACVAAVNFYKRTDYITKIAELGDKLARGINQHARELGLDDVVHGYAPIPFFRFSSDPLVNDQWAQSFMADCAARGVLFRKDVNFITAAHISADIEHAVQAAKGALTCIVKHQQNARHKL